MLFFFKLIAIQQLTMRTPKTECHFWIRNTVIFARNLILANSYLEIRLSVPPGSSNAGRAQH